MEITDKRRATGSRHGRPPGEIGLGGLGRRCYLPSPKIAGLVIDLDQPLAEKVGPMEKFIAQCNIAHFEELLSNETNPAEILILKSMLHEERTKLAAVEARLIAAAKFRPDPGLDRVAC